MLDSVKNKVQRTGLLSLLTFIVDGTKSAGFAFVPGDEADKLHKAEPTFIVLDRTVTNNEGQIKATATQVAIDALAQNPVAPATQPTSQVLAAEPIKFEFVKLDAIPPINRAGVKAESYPFEQLLAHPAEPHAFYIPATEARKQPAKSMASTVGSANKRNAKAGTGKVFTIRKHIKDGKEVGAYVIRTA